MTDTPNTTDQTIESFYAGSLAGKLASMAAKLDRLAAAVRLAEENLDESSKRGGYAGVVANVQHEVLWGLANLNLDGLVRDAQLADKYRIKGE